MQFLDPTFLLAVLVALTFHECAHAFVAYKLGDHTAKVEGRLTLNPIAHLDPLGTILFLTVGFGWGKPVPVNPYYFRQPTRDNALTAFAGPLSNFLLALISFVILTGFLSWSAANGDPWALLDHTSQNPNVVMRFFSNFLETSLLVNLGLMAFNLLPVAPLDGSKVLQAFIPPRYEMEYERVMQYGPYILLGLILAGRTIHFDLLGMWISTIVSGALHFFLALASALPF